MNPVNPTTSAEWQTYLDGAMPISSDFLLSVTERIIECLAERERELAELRVAFATDIRWRLPLIEPLPEVPWKREGRTQEKKTHQIRGTDLTNFRFWDKYAR